MCKFCKKSVKLFSMVVGVLFVVYFWNLDQKVLGWAYKQVNACLLYTSPSPRDS